MDLDLKGRMALVSGSTAGIGRRRRTTWVTVGNHAEHDANELPVGEKDVGGPIFR